MAVNGSGYIRRLPKIIILSIVFFLIFLCLCYGIISAQSRQYIFDEVEQIPATKVGLLLGTAPRTLQGRASSFFHNRISAAVELYRAGKIEYILASGDNSSPSYNEPIFMQKELIRRGIPREHIVLDYAGFSTLDSVIRARDVFGQDSFIVISQRFHNERAVYIASRSRIHAFAYNAVAVEGLAGLRVQFREVFARVKAILDVHVFNSQPKFLGNPILIL